MLNVEVVYAARKSQVMLKITVPEGATVEEAIQASGILQQYPEIDLAENKVGIFAEMVALTQVLRERDRIEIYRGLVIDPMLARRIRAAKKA